MDKAVEYESKTLSDYLALLKRRHKVLIWSLLIVSLVGVYIAYSLPAMYQSTSRFLIESQNIPDNIVQSTVTTYVDEQIQGVRQRVTSTKNVEQMISDHGLYPELTRTGDLQSAVDEFRLNTALETEVFEVANPRSGRSMQATISFTVSFDHTDPLVARDVAAKLANLYLSENIQSRTDQVQQAMEFIRSDIERYTREVETTGAALADFKEQNLGTLPELMNYNLQTIERTERQIDALERDIQDARNRELQLGSELARYEADETIYDASGTPVLNPTEQLAALQREKMRLISIYSAEHPDVIQIQKEIELLSNVASGSGTQVADIQAQVDAARIELAQLRQRYSDDHPDVVRSARSLENLELVLQRARTEGPSSSAMSSSTDPYGQQLRLRMRTDAANVQSLMRRKADLEEKLVELESKVALSPRVEREYDALNQSNLAAVANLNDARAKLEEAIKAEKLEAEGGGDKFTIIEPANLPTAPYKPNRPAILLLALVLSVGVGILVATALDAMDETVKGSRDVLRLINAPPLAVIPYVETESEHKKRVAANFGTVALVMSGVVLAIMIANFVG